MDTIAPPETAGLSVGGSNAVSRGVVLVYSAHERNDHAHDQACRIKIAEQLALLTNRSFGGEYGSCAGDAYLVPNETVVGIQRAHELGVRSEHDLFGGVVPYPFMATKVISHPLVDEGARAPQGWCPEFARRVQGSVLLGYSAFTLQDAHRAGRLLLERGAARAKPARAIGGRGQIVFADAVELEAALARIDSVELPNCGLVLEEDLKEVTTYSVGQVRVAELVATYCGTQRLTHSATGETVYGGSDLLVIRGDFEALLGAKLPDEARLAVAQARAYDAAAMELFTGMFASRRNYDVAQGTNAAGTWRSGVLEQSWRIGGASGAELCALLAFRADPSLSAVRASCFEIHGASESPPADAIVYYRGIDEQIGPITKYTLVEPCAYTR